ncbi:putative uncharacterized protein [Tetragenococcus halophilus subsp. halophilus]|uniref:hypothetical protein n=1 Tax=Tetragenococcus halophilus TaxID=51669 RepID=UPI000CB4AD0E|nr:hypothetical protein [Tetragenococcus halophilus]GBD74093.1 putative uncharacterized protein [Tetragenococcus halophilus subsp. halophilus]GBD76649.1 putative uncharacterized protein [Tetragenococcus halophilus subsp. halophilus]
MKLYMPKHIAEILDKTEIFLRWDVYNLWMGESYQEDLNGRTFEEWQEAVDGKNKIVKDWASGDLERVSLIIAYVNPVTSFKEHPELWEVSE